MNTNQKIEVTRKAGSDSRKCPPLKLQAKQGGGSGLIPLNHSSSLVDALYGTAVIGNTMRLAIDAGTVSARKTWYTLRRKVLRLEAQVAKSGYTLSWGQPWPAYDGGLTVYAYIVDGSSRVVGEGSVSAYEWEKCDHKMRSMMKVKAGE